MPRFCTNKHKRKKQNQHVRVKGRFEASGFSQVQTILNSGNVVFSCGNAATAEASDSGMYQWLEA